MAGPVIIKPEEIETESFRIIDAEVGSHHFDEQQWPLVRRIIHIAADFDFAETTHFSFRAVESGLEALRDGAKILCDTKMVLAGINKTRLAQLGGIAHCYVADNNIAARAKEEGVTRSIIALRKGVAEGCNIFLIGNASTALFELLRLTKAGEVDPLLVVGVPVGFVGATESKEALHHSDLRHICCRGRKGGSAIAATILNALMLQAAD